MTNFLLIHIVTSFHVVFIVLSSAGLPLPVKRTFVFSALHKKFRGKGSGKVTRWAILRVCLVKSSATTFLRSVLASTESLYTAYLATFMHD